MSNYQGLLFYGVLPERSGPLGETHFQKCWHTGEMHNESDTVSMSRLVEEDEELVGLGISFGDYGTFKTGYTGYPYLAIKEGVFESYGSHAKALPALRVGADWDERLRRACERLGARARTPGWHLAIIGDM